MVVDRHPDRNLPVTTGRPVGESLPVEGHVEQIAN
jgi:hypothetical protein